MNSTTKSAIAEKQTSAPALDETIKRHLDRLRAFAIANPCVFDEDLPKIFNEARNQMIFDYSDSWQVVASAIIFADYETEFGFSWQVTTSIANRETGKFKAIKFLTKKEQDQLLRARASILEIIADLGGSPTSRFRQGRLYSASCPLSFSEFIRLWRSLSDEQEQEFLEKVKGKNNKF